MPDIGHVMGQCKKEQGDRESSDIGFTFQKYYSILVYKKKIMTKIREIFIYYFFPNLFVCLFVFI